MKSRREVVKGGIAVAATVAATSVVAQTAMPQRRAMPFLNDESLRSMLTAPGTGRESAASLARDPQAFLNSQFRLTPDQQITIARIPAEMTQQLKLLAMAVGQGAGVRSIAFIGSGTNPDTGAPAGKTKEFSITFAFTF